MSYDLPTYGKLCINSLASIFNNTSASYKFVFFLSILKLIKDNPGRREFSFSEIEIEMIYIGWFPHTYYKLSFGLNDKLGDTINLIGDMDIKEKSEKDIKELIKSEITPLKSTLLDMVPYRLLSAFADSNEIDKKSDLQVVSWANSLKDSPRAFYSFNNSKAAKKGNSILISKPWLNYITEHYRIVKDFATFNFLSYMERRNPNVLNLSTKLFPPSGESRKLAKSKEFWLALSDHSGVRCIYTGDRLDKENISIDHYLPWSFTAHNREWNLIPTSREVNSKKSNNLPHKKYYKDFIKLQHIALNNFRDLDGGEKYIENYLIDLGISKDKLTIDSLDRHYSRLYDPLFKMARNQGFTGNWVYK